jgi:enoyl reductase-like protein
MVTIYDMYSEDSAKFDREMDNVSRSSIKMLLNDRITDEQFEKLLKRRDDLIERLKKQQKPPPSP